MGYEDYTFEATESECEIIKRRRVELGLTQQQVADAASINIRPYQKFESGERKISSTSFRIGVAIADVLELDVHELVHTPSAAEFLKNKIAFGKLKRKKNERIINIISENVVANVPQSDIVYAEVNNHTIIFHTVQKQISRRGTLTDIMEILGNDDFIQIHRSFVVAKSKIYKIKSTYPYSVDMLKGIDTINLPVSRSYIENLLEVYSDNMLERLI